MQITGNSALAQLGKTTKPAVSTAPQKPEKGASFDQITLNNRENMDGDSRMVQETASKISHEVRTHNTTSKIAQLKAEVESGTYQMDARETAARMLLMGDVE